MISHWNNIKNNEQDLKYYSSYQLYNDVYKLSINPDPQTDKAWNVREWLGGNGKSNACNAIMKTYWWC